MRAGKKTTKGAGGGRERNDRRHGVADNDSHSSPAARGAGDGAYSAPSEGGIVLSSIWDKLYAHQHYGVRWLLDLHQRGCGGILADDMG